MCSVTSVHVLNSFNIDKSKLFVDTTLPWYVQEKQNMEEDFDGIINDLRSEFKLEKDALTETNQKV